MRGHLNAIQLKFKTSLVYVDTPHAEKHGMAWITKIGKTWVYSFYNHLGTYGPRMDTFGTGKFMVHYPAHSIFLSELCHVFLLCKRTFKIVISQVEHTQSWPMARGFDFV